MLHNTAILLLLCSIPRVSGWASNPGPTCDQCCCCVVVANFGTRNFYAENGGSFLKTIIPNCYFLQTHLTNVIADWENQGIGVGDGDTFGAEYVWWIPTDPADGCYNDLATVTATNFNVGPTSPSGSVEPTSSNGGSSTTSTQSKYLSDRSFSITLIIFRKATATSSNSGSSTTSPQSKYLSDRSFSITLIIFRKATATSSNSPLPLNDRIDLGVGLGVGIPAAIAAIWQMVRWWRGGHHPRMNPM
jgi:hypothetical protein